MEFQEPATLNPHNYDPNEEVGHMIGNYKRAAIALSAASLLALAACGDSADTPQGGGDGGGGSDTVSIGGLWALSGPQAVYGDWYTNGSQLAVDQINAEGGINGEVQIELQIEDTQAQPQEAVVIFQRMVGQGVPFVLSSFSSQTLALMPIAEQNDVFVINGGAQSDPLATAGDLLYNTIPLIGYEAEVLTDYVVNEAGYKKAAIIYTSDDGGESARDKYEEFFTAAGGEVVAKASGEYSGTDYRSQLTQLRNSDAEVLLIGAFGQDTANIISQVREIGWDIPMANTSWAAIPDVLTNPAADGLLMTSIAFNPAPEFVADFTERYGEEPDSPYIANYYDGVKVFAEAYGKALETTDSPTGSDLLAAVQSMDSFDSAYGTPLVFDENGVALRPLDIVQLEGGELNVLAENYGG